MEKLKVGLENRSYPMWAGNGILSRLPQALRSIGFPRRMAVITNPTVGAIYTESVRTSLDAADFAVSVVEIPDGEEFKTLQTLEKIFDSLIELKLDRSCGVVALGGGVVGDITGFAAATFLRGIPFVQVPTTLLAQVDSSVGGKTGINHPLGKNLIGAFYQPRLVFIDVATLSTLPKREFSAGMAEVIKYGMIRDRQFFDWLVAEAPKLKALHPETLIEAVKRSCQIKADVVESDERESSIRAILNYGHTFGHAIETLAGYGQFRHGEAVAIGMIVAATISANQNLCSMEDIAALRDLLIAFDLPTVPPPFPLDDYLAAMGRDKKVREGTLRLILNRGIGDCVIREIADPEQTFRSALERLKSFSDEF